MSKRSVRKKAAKATKDEFLQLALERAETAYLKARAEAMEGFDLPAAQDQVRKIKEDCIAALPELIARFKEEAERLGVVVYEARTAEDANRYVAELAKARGVKLVVKSKSMLTEEIELNPHLEKEAIRVVETDLGEWIVQLAHEKPSHFTVPAAHKTREQVAELLSKEMGEHLEPDIPNLVKAARRFLRQAFIEADMGVSGANIAIADTGTLVIVTNEGNGRLVTTLPPIHVAIVGYEKLVRNLDDATAILKILARSGTGQKMTAYVSFISGPSRTTDIEKTLTLGVHGPGEVHIVFVDNGRMAMRDDPLVREALYCIKCGACLNMCPVYRTIGGHVFGNAYVGGIGAVVTAYHRSPAEAADTLSLCAGCRRCAEICPTRVNVPDAVLGLRGRQGPGALPHLAMSWMLLNKGRLDFVVRLARAAQKPLLDEDQMMRHSAVMPSLTDFRNLPAIPEKSLRDRLPDITQPKGGRRAVGRVALYAGCLVDLLYPEIGESAVEALSQCGYEVVFPKSQMCCGAPALYAGDPGLAAELASRNVKVLEEADCDYVITLCPTCGTALQRRFVELLEAGNDQPGADAARRLSQKVFDFSQFARDVIGLSESEFLADGTPGAVTYHDPCHLRRSMNVSRQPRELIQAGGYELIEMADSDVCCGFAGSYSFSYPEISGGILERKIANIRSAVEAGATVLATDCPGCILQLRGGLDKEGVGMRVCHTAQLVRERLRRELSRTAVPADIDREGEATGFAKLGA